VRGIERVADCVEVGFKGHGIAVSHTQRR
jgi:hypothetical protein